ncbi:MAG: hypothetical protein HZB68_02920 [Candidatus Aenigmarchaeota archaeon]|nr:hypothetical protein [Candidatus Aenigmarchaeota archaeon]
MEYTKIQSKNYAYEGLKDQVGEVSYSISGIFRQEEYDGHLQLSYRKKGDRTATTLNNTGYKGFLFVSRSGAEYVSNEKAREILSGERENFLKIRDEIASGKHGKLSKMLDEINALL